MLLLDTMIVPESFKARPEANVVGWLKSHDPVHLYVSVITFGEISAGIEKQRLSNVDAFQRLSDWAIETRREFRDRTLAVTTDVAMRWGELYMRLRRRDTDLLIAATALEHDLTVVTRNIRHFEPTGVKLFNPYE